MSPAVQTRRNDERSRYEGVVDGEVVTVVDFVDQGGVLTITHTGTDPARRGQGLAGAVTAAAFDDMRQRGEKVRPSCPFAVSFLDDHPEYANLRA